MGERGPVPKRSDHRRRTNEPDGAIDKAPGADRVEIPEPDAAWHSIARDWYLSLGESGQHLWYEPSDWQFARFVAELTSKALTASRLNGQLITAVMAGMTELLTTEGARRRARVELERELGVGDVDADRADATITELRALRGG